jgi:hypothetical protein
MVALLSVAAGNGVWTMYRQVATQPCSINRHPAACKYTLAHQMWGEGSNRC